MNRGEILDEAKRLTLGERDKSYGTPLINHTRIAGLWSIYLEQDITPSQVAICMGLVKVARLIESPNHLDSFVDLAAYASIAGEIESKI
jgi:hypothetical protein